jgi:hypothetical protein
MADPWTTVVQTDPSDATDSSARKPPRSQKPSGPAPGRAFDDEWRRWIAENLLVGATPESVAGVLQSSGFSPHDALDEVRRALASPYLRGAELLRNRLRKREWVLSIYRKLNRLHPGSAAVQRRHKLPRDVFLSEYYSTSRPVIITGMIDDWPAMKKWSLDYFAERLGDREVEVQMNRNADAEYEINAGQHGSRIRFAEFIEKIRTAGRTNDFYLTANNDSYNRAALPELWDDIVPVPEYLQSDRPGGFFWMGPAGTITPFHHDLTNNFMAQVLGRKRVKIAPSWDMPLMKNAQHCFSHVDGRVTSPAPSPPFEEPQIVECTLAPGEILFLPVGCLHFVEGLDVTVTVSFTNFVFDNDFHSYYTCFGPV